MCRLNIFKINHILLTIFEQRSKNNMFLAIIKKLIEIYFFVENDIIILVVSFKFFPFLLETF